MVERGMQRSKDPITKLLLACVMVLVVVYETVRYRLMPWKHIKCNSCGYIQRGDPNDYCNRCGYSATVGWYR